MKIAKIILGYDLNNVTTYSYDNIKVDYCK
jgi:hypothetical protein